MGITRMPWPLSVIWRSFRPPSLTRISICVDPASMEFSMSSFNAFEGRWMISPAAILSTTWDHKQEEKMDTFLSSRLMGLIGSSWSWGRFVPLGESIRVRKFDRRPTVDCHFPIFKTKLLRTISQLLIDIFITQFHFWNNIKYKQSNWWLSTCIYFGSH
jgi:hypothetical protein